MGDWQPIDTAPRDRTRVLLGWLGNPRVALGFYGPKISTYGVNYGDAWGWGERWDGQFEPQPTHWQPLPDGPG